MRAERLLLAVSTSLVLAGCAPASGGVSTSVPGDQPPNRLPRPGQSGGAGGTTASSTLRYVCRGQETSGWIAIDYIEDRDSCPTTRAPNSTAVIVPLANTTVGGMLEVCADQRMPMYWHRVQQNPGDSRCPPRQPTTAVNATVMTIQRDR